MCPQAGQSLANFAAEAIRSGDIDALKQALEKDRDLVSTAIDGKRHCSTSPRTGPATFRITQPAWWY